ncbi:hypothetical protein NPIL_393081 [Nephila pilipes]|uniref:Uncharacterized protein n=1 Tax=Nephila pilipes TaxID=299642 RepID=A0A8X6TNP3_NEPPI|nr:hypothetical protein NPIL_393081 [Nephila pilipes]
MTSKQRGVEALDCLWICYGVFVSFLLLMEYHSYNSSYLMCFLWHRLLWTHHINWSSSHGNYAGQIRVELLHHVDKKLVANFSST